MNDQGIQRPIFILGLNKSGTSLLYLYLSRHSKLSAVRSFKTPKSNSNRLATLYMEDFGIGEGQRIPCMPAKLQRGRDGSVARFATKAS